MAKPNVPEETADEAFHRISSRLFSAKCTLATATNALKASDAASTDEDVGHIERVLHDLVESVAVLQDEVEHFSMKHLPKTGLQAVES